MSVLPIMYLIFGLYFLNFGIGYIKIPELVVLANKWIIFAGGVLFLIASFRSIVHSKRRILRRALKQ